MFCIIATIFALLEYAQATCPVSCQFGTTGPCMHPATGLCFSYAGTHCDRGLLDCSQSLPTMTFTGCTNCTSGVGPCHTAGACSHYYQGTFRCAAPTELCAAQKVPVPAEYDLLFATDVGPTVEESFFHLRVDETNTLEHFAFLDPVTCITHCSVNPACRGVVMSNTRTCTILSSASVHDRTTTSELTYSLRKLPGTGSSSTQPATSVAAANTAPLTTTTLTQTTATITTATTSITSTTTTTTATSTTATTTTGTPTTKGASTNTLSVVTTTPQTGVNATTSTEELTTESVSTEATTTVVNSTPVMVTTSQSVHHVDFESENKPHEKSEYTLSESDKRMMLGIVISCVGLLLIALALFVARTEPKHQTLRRLPPSLPATDNNEFVVREGKPPYYRTPSPPADPDQADDVANPFLGNQIPRESPERAAADRAYCEIASSSANRPVMENAIYQQLYEDEMDTPARAVPAYLRKFQANAIHPPSVQATPQNPRAAAAADAEFNQAAGVYMGEDGVVDFGAMRQDAAASAYE
mmetsp:Transcript_245/g.821  ORF Transcript_245/g.821 Transcript_245/m.821 type:complete len:528 (-) Transcript_245:338-1921(-)